MKNRILQLLIGGMKASEISEIVGCSPSYVSQLLKDTDFKNLVEAGFIENQEVKTEEDHLETRYQNTEHKLLNAMNDALVGASLTELSGALSTLHRRTSMKLAAKRPLLPAVGSSITMNVVSLQLPSHALASHSPVITMNPQNEIIAIDNQPLAPMSAEGVKSLFAQLTDLKAIDQKILEEI